MKDYIVRATAAGGTVRAFAATTKKMAQEARVIHGTTPVTTAALGRALTGAAMMGCMLKNDGDLLTITLKGDGPMKGLVVTSDNKSNVKGYVHEPLVNIPLKENGKLDVGGAIGFGTMSVIKDMGLKEPVVGQIQLVSGEIADDLTYYFAKSEQVPSSVALGVLVDRDLSVKQSGGFILQMMPGATEDTIAMLEGKLPYLRPVTQMLEEGMTPEDILSELLGESNLHIHETIPVNYYCNCSRERVKRALVAVGEKELHDIIKEDGFANIHCHFCNKDYHFDEKELQNIIDGIK